MESLIVGIDVSKESFSAAGLDGKGTPCFSDVLPMDLDGFAKFLKTMLAKQPNFLEIVDFIYKSGADDLLTAVQFSGCSL